MTKTAFILAAGKGTRLRPYTDDTPKPMVKIKGKPIIHHIATECQEVGVENVIINLFYLGDKIKDYFEKWHKPRFIFSKEKEILDTGGGVKNALDHIKEEVFFLINGDAFWMNASQEKTLQTLINQWNPEIMDMLLLLEPLENMKLTHGVGDYNIDEHGHAIRSKNKTGGYMFTGIRVVKKSVFNNSPDNAFSFLELMDKAEEKGKLYGVSHKGDWHHISTPQDLENVNKALRGDSVL